MSVPRFVILVKNYGKDGGKWKCLLAISEVLVPYAKHIAEHAQGHQWIRLALVFKEAVKEKRLVFPVDLKKEVARSFVEGFINEAAFPAFQCCPIDTFCDGCGQKMLEKHASDFDSCEGVLKKAVVGTVAGFHDHRLK